MNLLSDSKAFLAKGNAMSVAAGVAVGMAVYQFADRLFDVLILPLLRFVTGGAEKGLLSGTLDWTYFKLGSLLLTIIGFAVVVAIIFAIFSILIPMFVGKSSSENNPPPPPAPPVV